MAETFAEVSNVRYVFLAAVLILSTMTGCFAGEETREDVEEAAAQWRFGGAPADSSTHTRIIDVAYPEGFEISREDALSGFAPQMVEATEFDALSADDFAQLPLVRP